MAKKTARPKTNSATSKTKARTAVKKSAPKKKVAAKKADAKKPAAKKAVKKKSAPTKAKAAVTKSPQARRTRVATVKVPQKKGKTAGAQRAAAATKTDKSVDSYAALLNDWRKDCVAALRKMIQKAAPGASEKVKWSQPVYEHHGPFAWIKAHTKHVNLGFWRGVELPDPRKLLSGAGEKMRHIKLSNLTDAGKKELQELVRLAAKLNELKGDPTRPAKKAKHK